MATNNVDLDSLRLTKIAKDIMRTLQGLLDKADNEQEFVDIIGLWLQAIGAEMATSQNATKDGIEEFLPFCTQSLRVAYKSRWEHINGEK